LENAFMSATVTTPESTSQEMPAGAVKQLVAEPPRSEHQAEAAHAVHGNPECPRTAEEEAELARIKDLPREVGVMLLTVGALGFVLPGVVGTPAAIAGGLVLWPRAFGRVENWFERKFPKMHKQSLYQINRYLNDLESRYPNATHRE
jgi:hypothetical protein